MTAVLAYRIAAGRPIAKVAAQCRCETRCVGSRSVRLQLAGKELANVIGSQPRYIDGAILELLLQQQACDVKPVLARSCRQPSYIAQMCVVAAQLARNVAGNDAEDRAFGVGRCEAVGFITVS